MSKTKLLFFLLFIFNISYGQVTDDMFSRIQAISNRGVDLFNVDGIEISSEEVVANFNSKEISKKFKKFKINKDELVEEDSLLGIQNYYVFRTHEEPKGIHTNTSFYFVKNSDYNITGFVFASVNKTDRNFEREFIKLVISDQIPRSVYNNVQIDSIDFAGRKIQLGNGCNWKGVNNVQCPFYGQMNWSVHKDFDDAKSTVKYQLEVIQAREQVKVLSDTTVNILFEGTETTAKKVIYDVTGVPSVLVGMSGGKTLTVYYVAALVRKNYVSCVLSFWNNDQINSSGLSPLLEEVMELK